MELASRKQRAERPAFAVVAPKNATSTSAHRLFFSLGAATAVVASFSLASAQRPGLLADPNSDVEDRPGSEKRRLFEREALPHVDTLYSTALRLSRNPEDARDLLQETVLRAYRFFHQYTPGTNCRAWLLTILYNNFRDAYRGADREQVSRTPEDFERAVESSSVQGDQGLSNPEMLVAEHVMDHEVAAALNGLPSDFRTVLILVDVQELNYQEVAQLLEIPLGTVKSRVSRGRQMMRLALGEFARRHGLIR
jgi:RNA polymerase sigma-70 factor, ECF subfamily